MSYRVVVTKEARDQLNALFRYLSDEAGKDTASRIVGELLDLAATLETFPLRGTPRDDLRPGLRTMPWKRRATLAYVVEDEDVVIIGVFYGGMDVEQALRM